MAEPYLLAGAKYIERNPVAAGIVRTPADYPWSSAKAHLSGAPDGLTTGTILNEIAGDWSKFLDEPLSARDISELKAHSATGRPLGNAAFITKLETTLGRILHKRKPGPPASQLS